MIRSGGLRVVVGSCIIVVVGSHHGGYVWELCFSLNVDLSLRGVAERVEFVGAVTARCFHSTVGAGRVERVAEVADAQLI